MLHREREESAQRGCNAADPNSVTSSARSRCEFLSLHCLPGASIALIAVSPVSAKAAASTCDSDQAGKISAEHQGKHGLRILAAAHSPISTVDTRRYYIDDDLACCRHGIRQVAVFQDFRTTELFNEGRFHNLSPLYAQRASFRE